MFDEEKLAEFWAAAIENGFIRIHMSDGSGLTASQAIKCMIELNNSRKQFIAMMAGDRSEMCEEIAQHKAMAVIKELREDGTYDVVIRPKKPRRQIELGCTLPSEIAQ